MAILDYVNACSRFEKETDIYSRDVVLYLFDWSRLRDLESMRKGMQAANFRNRAHQLAHPLHMQRSRNTNRMVEASHLQPSVSNQREGPFVLRGNVSVATARLSSRLQKF